MIETQLTAIRNYLLSKKLPIDILIEVNDHFVSQITDLQKEEHLGFEEAFEKTKENWKEDLKTSSPWYVLSNKDKMQSTKFEERIRKTENWEILKKSLIITLFLFVFTFIVNNLLMNDWAVYTLKYLYLSVVLFVSVTIFYNFLFNAVAYKKQYMPYRFSIFHWRNFIIFPICYFVISYIGGKNSLNQLLLHLKVNPSPEIVFQVLLFFLVIVGLIFTGIAQIKCAKTLKKVKPFLKYL